jgi:isocitrate/isopropylmalate dehydrogenase
MTITAPLKGMDANSTFKESTNGDIMSGARPHNYRIASIPADGIGPEVVSAAIEVVQKLSATLKTFTIEFTHIPWGTAYYKEHGRYVDVNVLEVLRGFDACLFGSVGAPGNFQFLQQSNLQRSPNSSH